MHVLAQVMYLGQNDLTTSICAIYKCKQKFTTVTSHTGKDDSLDSSNGVTHDVLKLVEGLENKGHNLYCDNYYTSPVLFSLSTLGFEACGTVRVDGACQRKWQQLSWRKKRWRVRRWRRGCLAWSGWISDRSTCWAPSMMIPWCPNEGGHSMFQAE